MHLSDDEKAIFTWTRILYQQGVIQRFDQHIAWSEPNAIAFADSVIGVRTNRSMAEAFPCLPWNLRPSKC